MDDRPRTPEEPQRRSGPSLFWPILLIGIGAIWLLRTLGLVPLGSLALVLRLWPALLVLIGLDLLFGRRWPALGAALGLITVAAVALILIVSPPSSGDDLAFLGSGELRTRELSHPLDGVERARVELALSQWPTDVVTSPGLPNLLEARIDYTGELRFRASGTTSRPVVHLSRTGFLPWFSLGGDEGRWDIVLSPEVPLELAVNAGSGRAELDLRSLDLEALEVDGGSGALEADLPAGAYPLRVDAGSGPMAMRVAAGAALDGDIEGGSGRLALSIGPSAVGELRFDGGSGPTEIAVGESADLRLTVEGGSGPVRVELDPDTPMRIEVDDVGSGRISLPDGLRRTAGNEEDETGVWETEGYADAARRVVVKMRTGSGPVTVR